MYLERSREALESNGIRTALSGDVQEEVIAKFLSSTPAYKDYDEFLKKAKHNE